MADSVGFAAREQPSAALARLELAQLPPEVWQVVARHALAACGDSFDAWLWLRAVSRAWWQGLEGACHARLFGTECSMCTSNAVSQ